GGRGRVRAAGAHGSTGGERERHLNIPGAIARGGRSDLPPSPPPTIFPTASDTHVTGCPHIPEQAMRVPAIIAFVIYCSSIVVANWLILNVGTVRLPDGTYLVPVGFGLIAPSGAFAAGATFVARDVVQRVAVRRWAVVAILAGTVLSVMV